MVIRSSPRNAKNPLIFFLSPSQIDVGCEFMGEGLAIKLDLVFRLITPMSRFWPVSEAKVDILVRELPSYESHNLFSMLALVKLTLNLVSYKLHKL